MATWDNKAISGKDLQEQVLTPLSTEIKKKQDKVDAEYDSTNKRLVLKNIDIVVASQT